MKLLEKILVPVDINVNSNAQLKTAIKIARSYHSEIILLYVVPEEALHDEIKEIVMNAISDSLNSLKKSLIKERVIFREPLIEFGKPVDKILQMATHENVNLILVGSGTRDKRKKYRLGTTAERLISLSDVPVWVAKSNQITDLKNVLCPVDYSDPSKRALKNAILLSAKLLVRLTILAVFEPITYVSPRIKLDLEKENALRLKRFEKEMKVFIREFDLNGINHEIVIQTGIVHEVILQSIKENGYGLLIMGTNGRSGLSRFLMGSITEKVIREVPCSFITTKTLDIIRLKINNEIKEIEIHFRNGNELVETGAYAEAINQFMICLKINDMHIPSINKLAEVHRILGDTAKAEHFDKMAKDISARLWDKKIELEIRRHYRYED
jgi:nucleotide-binding universal stress UspA family protein